MKLQLRNASPVVPPPAFGYPGAEQSRPLASEVFNVPREIGVLLLALGKGDIVEVVDPVKPVDLRVRWEILGGLKTKAVFLRATCPACHQGMTTEALVPFLHCRKSDEAPEDMQDQFRQLTRKREPIKIEFPPPMDLSSF